jgi:hypothetical protein
MNQAGILIRFQRLGEFDRQHSVPNIDGEPAGSVFFSKLWTPDSILV